MTNKTLNSRHALDSFTYQLHSWKPFQQQTLTRTLDSSDLSNNNNNPKPNNSSPSTPPKITQNKRTCLCDRSFSIDSVVDMSKLNLLEDERNTTTVTNTATPHKHREKFWIPRKRRRRGSRSVSGRSSDRSGTRRCSVGASAAYATCSDFPVAAGTDSSGELFVNGDANWSSDVSEAKNSRKEGKDSGEKENLGFGSWQFGGIDALGNESGYGSEPGYRGDAELGYGDEFDEEEDDGRVLFWGEGIGDTDCDMEIVGDNTFSEAKTHHRCRRKKHEWRMDGISR
ncbi:hypothetical protein AQUCO_01700171v1 [Aquilegia coerulea]|uniref:Uncharacterized protein n=1 Tax=Aquilegia coerulea TaxID=218851 RepID=A0A2G5DLM0_AQUCA|nr:hypothetical protein AQUCO_01700171v1 [Aquilegia coerulea]